MNNGMELIDNINKTLKSDLITELRSGSKVSIAVSVSLSMPLQKLST